MKVQCKRMIQFVHFHLSTHIFELKADQDRISQDEGTPLADVYKTKNLGAQTQLLKDAQNYRDKLANHLINDGWQAEGIALLEENRQFQMNLSQQQQKPEEFFKYELQILNYSKTMAKTDRYTRFVDLINTDFK
jgi:hypothetical protein